MSYGQGLMAITMFIFGAAVVDSCAMLGSFMILGSIATFIFAKI